MNTVTSDTSEDTGPDPDLEADDDASPEELAAELDAQEDARREAERLARLATADAEAERRRLEDEQADPARRAAAAVLRCRPHEVDYVRRVKAGLVIGYNGRELIHVPTDRPDGEGKTGLMEMTRTGGTFPVYVSAREARRAARAVQRDASRADRREGRTGLGAHVLDAVARWWAADDVCNALLRERDHAAAQKAVADVSGHGGPDLEALAHVDGLLDLRRKRLRSVLLSGPVQDVERDRATKALRAAEADLAAGVGDGYDATMHPAYRRDEALARLASLMLDRDGTPLYDSAFRARLVADLDRAEADENARHPAPPGREPLGWRWIAARVRPQPGPLPPVLDPIPDHLLDGFQTVHPDHANTVGENVFMFRFNDLVEKAR